MNTKNLILTSTVTMSREEWLAFRQPLNHVKNKLQEISSMLYGQQVTFAKSNVEYEILRKIFMNSEAWKHYQFPCIGGSEISCLAGLNPYKAIIELFYEKVGIKPVYNEDNAAMFWGRELEQQIADKWQYWDGSSDGMILNFNSDNVIRRCRRINSYAQNRAFPWIFVSLDRIINQSKEAKEQALECKTISDYTAKLWESGIPPMYVAQLQTQLAVFEFTAGEMAILKDGRYLEVYPFDKSEQICSRMIKLSEDFFNKVKVGIEHYLLSEASPDEQTKLEHLAKIDELAPEPDGSDSYKDYLSNTYEDKGYEITGGPEELELAKDYKYFANQIKAVEVLKTERSNKLKAIMKDGSKITFGPEGNCTWREGAKSRTFLVNVTPEPDYRPKSMKVGIEEADLETVDAQEINTEKPKKGAKKAG